MWSVKKNIFRWCPFPWGLLSHVFIQPFSSSSLLCNLIWLGYVSLTAFSLAFRIYSVCLQPLVNKSELCLLKSVVLWLILLANGKHVPCSVPGQGYSVWRSHVSWMIFATLRRMLACLHQHVSFQTSTVPSVSFNRAKVVDVISTVFVTSSVHKQ